MRFLTEVLQNSFHEKCDGYENTLTIIRSENGRIFGGFTRLSWESGENQKKVDNKGFLFSYDSKEIYYRNTNYNVEIITGSNHGPEFGEFSDLKIEDNCLHNSNSYDHTFGRLSYITNGKEYVLNGSKT